MPGNEVGGRVHNFFAQENLSQGQHHSQALDGNWPVLSNSLWPGNQRQVGLVSTTTKNYNPQQSGSDGGQVGNALHGSHGLTFIQLSARPEFAKSQSQSQQPNFNDFTHGNQFYQTRQDGPNLLTADTNSDQRNLTSRSIPTYGSQQVNGPENQGKSSVRPETSGPPVSFDFFGGQQQMGHQQLSMLQSLQHQPSGLNDIQQLQQQVMLMKMQELQRQQQLQQMDAGQQGLINQMPPFAKQASGSQPAALLNGSVNSDALSYHWANELGNANWLQRSPPAMQRSSNGLVFSPNQGQLQRLMDLVPQHVDQSLYGVPVSSSRGSLNQYPQMVTEKSSVQQQATFGNSLPANQYTTIPGQVSMQDRNLSPRQRFQAENSFGYASGQALSTAINMENSMQRNAHLQEFGGKQEQLAPRETLQEKTDTLDITSRDDVALDPTEERILFGSDDNIWAAFGKSPNMGGEGSNLFDGAGFNRFSSIQSGTWSALMQSAVAETSSSGIGSQEEWSGLNFQNNDIPSGNQHALSCNDGRNQQTPLGIDNLSMASSFASGTVPPSGDLNMKKNYQNVLGFQQLGPKFSYETAQRLQANPSQGLDQSSEDGGRWSNGIRIRKSGAEASQVHGNASHSLDTESSASRQLCNKPNGWNVFGSITPYGDAGLTVHWSENSMQHSQSNEQKQIMHREVVDGGALWNSNSGRDLTIEMEQVKSALGSSQVNKEAFGSSNAAVLSDSSAMRAGEGSSQFLPNSYQLNSWKNADPLVKFKVGEVVGGSQHENKICSSKEEGRVLEMENSDKQENSNDSYCSNLSHHTSAGGQKEHAAADAIDSRTLSAGKQKSSNEMGRKSTTSLKFQYHPMGNLDDNVEPYHGVKQPIYSQAMSHLGQSRFLGQLPKNSSETGKGQSADLQRSNKGFDEEHSPGNFPGSIPNISSPLNRSLDIGTQDKASQSSQNMLELLHKVDQSRGHAAMMHVIASEPNAASEMPQAENSDVSVARLQRCQSSNSQGFGLQLGPPMQRPIPNQSLSSQSSLQGVSSLHSAHAASEIGQKGQARLVPSSFVQSMHPSSEKSLGENNRPGVPGQTGTETSPYKMPGNFSSAFNSGFPHSRGQLQSQEIAWASGQLSRSLEKHASHSTQKDDPNNIPTASQSPETSFPGEARSIPRSKSVSSGTKQISTNILPGKVLAPQGSAGKPVLVSQSSTMSGNSLQGTSSKALPNMWSNVAAAQHLLGAQFHKVSSQFSLSNQTNLANPTSSASLNKGEQDGKQGNFPSEFGASSANSQGFRSEEEQLTKERTDQQVSSEDMNLVQKMNISRGEPILKTLSDGSPANAVSTQQDIEAFGRSLKPNNFLKQNYSLLNQMRVMKNADDDPSNRVLKRMKGPDSGLGVQLVPPMGQSNDLTAIVGDALVPRNTLTSVDPTMLSFSAPENNKERNLSSQDGNIASQSLLAFSQDGSQSSNTAASTKIDHSKISPQMTPSWFNQYGTFKNGQILPTYDTHKAAILKTGEQPSTLGKSSSGLHTLNSMELLSAAAVEMNQVGSIRQSVTPSVAAEYLSSLVLPSNVSGHHPVISRTKKRKNATSEFDPWHKEVLQGSQSLLSISMAEVEWAKATNRLINKVEEDVELTEDGSLMLKPKRRLILSTQLMQQLFRLPPAAILSMDANLEYESVAYSISRLTLGDACSVVSLTNDKFSALHNRNSDECKTSESVDDQLLLKVIDDLMARARNLENEFFRLDNSASVLDLIVECQDLEKFSVINRFARFHGRGQADSAQAASSSDAAANTHKPYPQRYVTAIPLPRNLPTRVQCCSL